MGQIDLIHEHLRFGSLDRLAGVLSYPAVGEPETAVLVCSPHPNFGGDLENNVVAALAEALSANAIALRFDYRGVGQSRIELRPGLSGFDYWENIEETLDYTEPLADTGAAVTELASLSAGLPIIAVGYSFGAIMATRIAVSDERVIAMVGVSPPLKRVGFEHLAECRKPCLLVSGQDDFVFDADAAKKLIESAGPNIIFERPAADHFFVGLEPELAAAVLRFVRQSRLPVQCKGADGSQ